MCRAAWILTQTILLVSSLIHSGSLNGATITWSGAGADDLWSTPANWFGGVIPATGDTVVYGPSGGGDNVANLSLALDSIRFAPQILPEHNFRLVSGNTLTLTGFGIDNVSRIPGFGEPPNPPGVIRQQLTINENSTLAFQNTATVGGTEPVFNLPVDLNARGATTIGGNGGRILFEHNSTASGPPANAFTVLRVEGGTVGGAGGARNRTRGAQFPCEHRPC